MDAGYTGEGRGADWVQKALGWIAEIVQHPPKLAPEDVMRRWVRERAKDGVTIDPEKLLWPRTLGDRADLFLALSEPPYEQGLRALGCHERGVRLRGDESLDGEAFGSIMRLFRQFPTRQSRE